ncbi:uncharacterized mitochondrial protein AtMg00860-like [Pyrus communis]|uniref:uncharacterized mitochondrial protein AtMg00860-like n=1 Tax=Pyrus communis TaxID=23211 RepID=UPI0035BF5254
MDHLKTVFHLLQANTLFVKKSKCAFGQTTMEYLGHIFSQDGLAADLFKLEAIANWRIVGPLTAFTKKDNFHWSEAATTAFQELKQAMLSPHVLALPNFSQPFTIETNASGFGIGDVLQQSGQPIAFTSKALSVRNQSLSAYEREMMAILHAIKKWKNKIQEVLYPSDSTVLSTLRYKVKNEFLRLHHWATTKQGENCYLGGGG